MCLFFKLGHFIQLQLCHLKNNDKKASTQKEKKSDDGSDDRAKREKKKEGIPSTSDCKSPRGTLQEAEEFFKTRLFVF